MRNIKLAKYEVEDFVSVEVENGLIQVIKFNGKVQVGTPGWCSVIAMTPEQAQQLVDELTNKINLMRGE